MDNFFRPAYVEESLIPSILGPSYISNFLPALNNAIFLIGES